jgi:hypothetical protein
MPRKSNKPARPGVPSGSEIVLYQTEDEQTRIEVRLDGGTVWLSQRMLSDLYQVSVPTINEHLGNIYSEKELEPGATIRKFRIVQTEGGRAVTRMVDCRKMAASFGAKPGAIPMNNELVRHAYTLPPASPIRRSAVVGYPVSSNSRTNGERKCSRWLHKSQANRFPSNPV